jgi:hypothetical protein
MSPALMKAETICGFKEVPSTVVANVIAAVDAPGPVKKWSGPQIG